MPGSSWKLMIHTPCGCTSLESLGIAILFPTAKLIPSCENKYMAKLVYLREREFNLWCYVTRPNGIPGPGIRPMFLFRTCSFSRRCPNELLASLIWHLFILPNMFCFPDPTNEFLSRQLWPRPAKPGFLKKSLRK